MSELASPKFWYPWISYILIRSFLVGGTIIDGLIAVIGASPTLDTNRRLDRLRLDLTSIDYVAIVRPLPEVRLRTVYWAFPTFSTQDYVPALGVIWGGNGELSLFYARIYAP